MYKKCWIFSIKKPTFFWVFLNKKCVSEKRSKTFENQIFFTKIAIEIAILSQEYSKIYRNICRNFVAIFSTSLQHRFNIFANFFKTLHSTVFKTLQNASTHFESLNNRLNTFENVWKRLKTSQNVAICPVTAHSCSESLKNGHFFLPSAGQKKKP